MYLSLITVSNCRHGFNKCSQCWHECAGQTQQWYSVSNLMSTIVPCRLETFLAQQWHFDFWAQKSKCPISIFIQAQKTPTYTSKVWNISQHWNAVSHKDFRWFLKCWQAKRKIILPPSIWSMKYFTTRLLGMDNCYKNVAHCPEIISWCGGMWKHAAATVYPTFPEKFQGKQCYDKWQDISWAAYLTVYIG